MYIIKKLKRKFAIALAACIVMTNALPVFAEPVFEEDQYAEAVEAAEASEAAKEELLPVTNEEAGEDGTVSALLATGPEPVTYTVEFNENGGTGSMNPQVMTYDVAEKLNPHTFTPPDEREFAGWALTNTSTEPVFADGEVVRNLADTQGATVELYAVWVKDSDYTVVHYLIDKDSYGHGTIGNNIDIWEPSQSGLPKGSVATANEGYNFVGWKDADGNFITETTDDVVLSNYGKTITPKQASTKDTYYTAFFKKQPTIAEILPKDFPTTEAAGWENKNGKKAYISSDSLNIGGCCLPSDRGLTSFDKGYSCTGQFDGEEITFCFKMSDDKLQSIEVIKGIQPKHELLYGEYKPVPSITLTADRLGCVKDDSIVFTATVENVTATTVSFIENGGVCMVGIVDGTGSKSIEQKTLGFVTVMASVQTDGGSVNDTIDILVTEQKPDITMSCEKRFEVGDEIEFLISTSFLPDGTDIVVSEGTDTWTVTVKDNQATFKGPKKTKAGDYIYTGTITQFDIDSSILVSVKEPSQKIDPPTADTHTYTYNGAKQTYSPVGFDPAVMVMENGLQKDAGTYEVKVGPKDGYVWEDGTREPVVFTWAISPKYVGGFKWTEPDSKVYDGTPLNIGISCEDICSGDDCRLNCTIHKDSADGEAVTEAKDPGTYVGVPDNQLSGRDSANYELSGPLPEAKTYTITPKPVPAPSSSNSEPLFTGTWANPVKSGKWTQDANGIWSYTSTEVFRNTWGYIVNPFAGESQNKADWFYFDQYGHMLTGWQLVNGKWYYLNPMKDGTLGACQLGGVTPDGWTVDESGAWIESIPRK